MNREILDPKTYYYTDAIEDFDKFMSVIDELDALGSPDGEINNWNNWTSSNDKTFIYGLTKTFDAVAIRGLDDPIKEKMAYIYNAVLKTFNDVSKDYAADYEAGERDPAFILEYIKALNASNKNSLPISNKYLIQL